MSTETKQLQKEIAQVKENLAPKTTRKRARKPSTVATFLDRTRAEMTAKAKELDAEVNKAKRSLDSKDNEHNKMAMKMMEERNAIAADLMPVDLSGVTAKNDTPVEADSNTRKKPRKYAKLTQKIADDIRTDNGMQEDIATKYGCSVAMVSRIKSGQRWAPKS